MFGWELDPEEYLLVGIVIGILLSYFVYQLKRIKDYIMKAVENLAAAVSSLEAAANAYSQSVEVYKSNAAVGSVDEAAVMVQVERVNSIANMLMDASSKVNAA